MKKKGFTLIELLAVIVILAIIALIATPIVMNVIENSRKGAAERSAENYLDAVETAVATERLDGKTLNGDYTIQSDGSICPVSGCGQDNVDKVTIDMNGNKPSGGTILIENGLVSKTSAFKISGYLINYNSEGNLVASKKICVPVGTATTGNVPSGNYAYGDEYICELGDGIIRTFFVLEDGDDPKLTKGDFTVQHNNNSALGTAGSNEVSLIMDRNIDNETIKWCKTGKQCSCNADNAKEYLQAQTTNWTNPKILSIDLPTYAQIEAANNNNILKLQTWLYDYLYETTHHVSEVCGYYTSTSHFASDVLWIVRYNAQVGTTYANNDLDWGVRPVITISKNELAS